MRRIGYRMPSPAMMVAFLALLVALGGTSYAAITLPANSVGTKQLKKNAVTGKKVKNRSLKAIDFATGQLPAGPQGATGPQGPKGDTGPRGESGVSKVTSRQAETTGSGVVTAEATCNAGERLIGGGGISESGLMAESESDASPGGTPTKWVVTGVDDPASGDFLVVAEALCAS
jgi:hypothetical protein